MYRCGFNIKGIALIYNLFTTLISVLSSKGKTYVDRCLSSSGSQKTNDCCIKPLQSFSHSNDFLFFTYRDFPIFEEFLIKEFNLFTFFEKLVVVW